MEKRKESIAWLKNHLDKALYNSRTVNKVVDEKNCSGCGACQEVCPKDAINLKYNNEGFLVPEIAQRKMCEMWHMFEKMYIGKSGV